MQFYSRKLIKPEDLNGRNTLFGGALLGWIDEEAGIYARTNTEKWTRTMVSGEFICCSIVSPLSCGC